MSAPSGYHVQPAQGWLNDPNGLVFHDGRWHVFFQHNPAAPRHGNIAWGHVSSPDLVRWTEHPIAFRPEPGGPDDGGCWSGVSVRVGERIAAVYTGIRSGPADSIVCLRYACDSALDEWSGPRVVGTEPSGVGVREMRDPFVFTWSGHRWAVLGAWLDDGPGLLLWSCDDLEAWRFERVWFTIEHPVVRTLAAADVWECPQLVQVDGSWVLMVSLWKAGILDRVVYAVGSLVDDGGRPRFVPRSAGLVDEGTVLYAPQVLQDAPGGGPVLFGWIREPEVLGPEVLGPAEPADPVVGCLSLPRRLGLEGDRLVSAVDPAVLALLGEKLPIGSDEHLPPQSLLHVGPTPITLAGAATKVELPAHTDVWLDGEVLEAYPSGGAPRTYRDPGTMAWRLLERPSDVRARAVWSRLSARSSSGAPPE